MRPVEGKYYRTEIGEKVGPLRRVPDGYSGGDWALWETDDATYELVGVLREDALTTDIVAEWAEKTPKRWGDMTSEEKGALLLAHHEGKVIEVRAENCDIWYIRENPNWSENGIFRIRHEPVVETVVMHGEQSYCGFWGFDTGSNTAEYRITFDTIDGEPDCASIRMEKL